MNTVFVSPLNPIAAVFPVGVLPAVNPAIPTTGLFAAAGSQAFSAYTDISGHRMMFPPPEFQVIPMFAAPVQNGGGSNAGLPPAGSGNGGSIGGGGNGRKNDPFEAVNQIRRMIPEIRRSDELTRQIATSIEGFATIAEKLQYIGGVSSLLESTPPETFRFSTLALASIAHDIASRADELTGYVTPGGVTVKTGVDEANMLKPLFNFTVGLEKLLLQKHSLVTDASLMIAAVHFIFVRKGLYTYALRDAAAGKENPVALILTVLHLLDILKRYDVAGFQRDTRLVKAFLEEVRATHKIPQDAGRWALQKYHEMTDGNLAALSVMKKEADILENAMSLFDPSVNDFTRGLYLFSPGIFGYLAAGFTEMGLGQYAEKYAKRSQEEFTTASQLGLTE